MVVIRSFVFAALLFFSCWFTLPVPAVAGGKGEGNNDIGILLATGIVAKLLQGRRGGPEGGRSVPIGGTHRTHPVGAQSTRILVQHPPMAPPMPYQPYMQQQPQPMMTFVEPTHMMPPPHTSQKSMSQSHQQSSHSYPTQTTSQSTSYGFYTDYQPQDKIEVIHIN